MTTGQGEAEITRPDGSRIVLRGDTTFLAEAVALIDGATRQQSRPASPAGPFASAARPSASVDLTSIAEIDDQHNLQLTVTDLKGTSQADATQRLIYVALLARRQLLNEKKTSRKELLRHLRDYGLADGNSRALISSDKSLVKEGSKFIWLSAIAVAMATDFVKQIDDPNVVGTWARTRRTPRKKPASRSGGTVSQEQNGH